MTTNVILMYAVGVFALMVIGIILTMIEFNKLTDEPSQRKGDGGSKKVEQATEQPPVRAELRLVHRDNAA